MPQGAFHVKVYAEDTPILTIDSIVICQTHAEDLRRRLLKMHPGKCLLDKRSDNLCHLSMLRKRGGGGMAYVGHLIDFCFPTLGNLVATISQRQ